MLLLQAEWPSKIHLDCRNNFVRTRPVAAFRVWGDQNTFFGEKDFCFFYMFKTKFPEQNTI